MNIDTATKAELLAYAEEELGLVLDPQSTLADLRSKVKDASGLADLVAEDPAPTKSRKAKSTDPWSKMITINIHKTEDESGGDDVFVGVNGRPFLIKRGTDVAVPEPVYEALKNAITEKRNMKRVRRADGTQSMELEIREVQSYPFSVVSR